LLPILFAVLFWTGLVAGMAYWHIATVRSEVEDLGRMEARSFFELIVLTRKWNAIHGGVYVPVTENTQPNPYLEDPLRDVETTEGLQLTMINPAYMTRQMAELAETERSLQIHITSLDPIRPENRADAWETGALRQFEQGVPEVFSRLTNKQGTDVFRYMAPLITEQPCLKCHEKQGYKSGEIRGGIRVEFPAGPIAQLMKDETHIVSAGYGSIWLIGLLILLLVFWALHRKRKQLAVVSSDLRVLQGILPICANCKKIRTDEGDWERLEEYVTGHSEAEFSHGICPECRVELYPNIDSKK